MIVAGYIGNHSTDSLLVRLGWFFTRLVQRTDFKQVTHTEMIFKHHGGGLVDMGSSSIRDNGVRIKKQTQLSLENWLFIEVPGWHSQTSFEYVAAREGMPYDWRGALATVLPGHGLNDESFCNEICGASVGLNSPDAFGPAQFMSIALSMPGAHIVNLS